ncbi:hypothetical protein ABPG77_010505 [Micractinium sp. CCAP 211/92]
MAPKRKAAAGGAAAAKKAKPEEQPAAQAAHSVEIEHCKANELEKLVQESVPGAEFVVNAEKPRKGCFEVRRGGKVYVSLQSLPRPFTKLRNLDLAEVAERVVADLQGAAGTAGTAEPAGAAKEEPAEAQQEEEEQEAVVEKPKAKKAGGRKGKK